MRDNFCFFRSYYEAIDKLGEKSQLKLYKIIMKLSFNRCENETELEQLCNEIETKLEQNRSVFATYLLIKPHLIKSAKQSLKGRLGGAQKGNKNAQKNKQIEIEIEKGIEIEKENSRLVSDNFDNFYPIDSSTANPDIAKCFEIYKRECSDLAPLGFEPRNREIREKLAKYLQETGSDISYFTEVCKAANKLKFIADKLICFKSMINNYIGIMNGAYKPKEKTSVLDNLDFLKVKEKELENEFRGVHQEVN